MSVLFMMPLWAAPSEVWLQRMMEELGNDLGTVVVSDSGGKNNWRNKVRVVSLDPRHGYYLSRLYAITRRRLNMTPSRDNILLRECLSKQITHILCHYGDHAISFASVWKKINKPIFVHFHGFDATFDFRDDCQPNKRIFAYDYPDQICKLSTYATLIANSNTTKSWLEKAGVPSDRIVVKYLGVPLPTLGKIHINKNVINIVQIGRLIDCKSPDRTIKAFEIVRSKGIPAQLTLAGDGPLRITCELLKARSPYRDSIQLLGAVNQEQVKSLLDSGDIFTQHNIQGEITRQSEAFGVSILEAMANGLPVVGTRHGGVTETVVDNETGFLGTPGNIEEQAEAIIKLAENVSLRQQFGNAGRERVAKYFSMSQEAKQLREIMQLPQMSK